MMNESLLLIIAFVAGSTLGIIFFGGLWFTVGKVVMSERPALWVFSSFIVRIIIVLVGFYFVGAGNWQRLILCLLGFITARFMVIHFTKTLHTKQLHLEKEKLHGFKS